MNEFISEYQYHIAWSIYIVSGALFSMFWWRLTAVIGHGGWRDLLRGVAIVVIFTPWYVSEAREQAAPAAMVVAMDLLVGSTDNGLAASLTLLVTTAAMLALIIVRRVLKTRNHAS